MSMALLGPSGRIVLDAPVYTFGNALDNQFVLQDPKVSPRHAVLQLQEQQYNIVDLGSVDGTYLNEQRLGPNMPVFLRNGDKIRIGDTFYTFEASPLAAPTYPPTVVASSSPAYASTVQASQPPAAPAYGQSNPAFPPYEQVAPAAPAYGQQPVAATYGQSGVSSPGYPPYAPPAPSGPNAPGVAYTPAPGQPYAPQQPLGAGMPPVYAPPAQPQKKRGMVILLIVLAIVLVLGGTGIGTYLYIVNLPQPTINVISKYSAGSIKAGASSTTFTVSGKRFSHSSTITFLLDNATIPGGSTALSDSDGNLPATTLTVTSDWTVGNHTLTAKDAAGYVTKTATTITIVTPGQDNTPGPNGAPTDSASGAIAVTVQGAGGSDTLTLNVTNGTVCRDIDNGQPRSVDDTDSSGDKFTETLTSTCSGTYKGGKLTYIETVTSDKVVFTSGQVKGVTCTTQNSYVLRHMDGTFTTATDISGSISSDPVSLTCKLGSFSQSNNIPAQQGTWTGIATMQ